MTDERLVLRSNDGATAVIHLHGAHVTSWTTPDGAAQLYLSERAVLDGRAPIRGGIPVIFPQFAGEGPLPKHGFARTTRWEVSAVQPGGAAPLVVLELMDSVPTRAIWPHAFRMRLRVDLEPRALRLTLTVDNTGDSEFRFTTALHTYLRVADAAATTLAGLEGLEFRDSASDGEVARQGDRLLTMSGEVNRIYFRATRPIQMVEPVRTRTISMTGFRDAVIWNPGGAGEAALHDMAPGGSARMICVEAAAIETPVALGPHQSWTGTQRLEVTSP